MTNSDVAGTSKSIVRHFTSSDGRSVQPSRDGKLVNTEGHSGLGRQLDYRVHTDGHGYLQALSELFGVGADCIEVRVWADGQTHFGGTVELHPVDAGIPLAADRVSGYLDPHCDERAGVLFRVRGDGKGGEIDVIAGDGRSPGTARRPRAPAGWDCPSR